MAHGDVVEVETLWFGAATELEGAEFDISVNEAFLVVVLNHFNHGDS